MFENKERTHAPSWKADRNPRGGDPRLGGVGPGTRHAGHAEERSGNGTADGDEKALGRSYYLDAVFIISAAGDLPDKATATDRLLQNQVDIGNAIKPYYGDAAGDKLTALLKEHITTAAEVVTAAKANDSANVGHQS